MNSINNIKPIIKVDNINKHFGKIKVLENANLEVMPGEITLLTGENGSGKSTLMRIIAGLIPANSGKVTFNGIDITNKRPDAITKLGISSLLQGGIIFPKLYVYEHFQLALKGAGQIYSNKETEKVYELFPDIQRISKKRAGFLSGGERQMLALSLLILQKAKLWLLDEPISGLSPAVIKIVTESIISYCIESKITVILIEQRTNEFQKIANNIYTISSGRVL
jgi:branched-chain amino acid transport system ATP-binding protein